MFSVNKAFIAGILGAAVAISGTPSYAMAATESDSVKKTDIQTEIQVLESTDDSAKLKIKDGSVKENADGTVTISNDETGDSATLKSAVLLSDGSVSHIDYVVDGNEIGATLSTPVVEGEKEPVVDQGWVECGMATVGAISAIGMVPVTGGASAVILPALGAGATAGGATYACTQAAEG